MDKYVLLLFLLQLAIYSQGQNVFSGLVEEETTLSKIPVADFKTVATKSGAINSLSLSAFCPTASDQGALGSCVGFAFGHGAMTVIYTLQNKIFDKKIIDSLSFSSSFIFNQTKIKEDCKAGASLPNAALLLKEKGICPQKVFNTSDCTLPISKATFEIAAAFKIQEVYSLFDKRKASENDKVTSIKRILQDSLPVVINMQAFRSFREARGKAIWGGQVEGDQYLGKHACLVIGYDDKSETFELFNSWGISWGKNGFIQIPYDEMGKLCISAYGLVPATFNVDYKGLLQEPIQILTKYKHNILTESTEKIANEFTIFRLENTRRKRLPVKKINDLGVYKPLSNITLNDTFQLKTNVLSRGQYIYIFSYDPNGKMELHYPPPEQDSLFKKTAFTLTNNNQVFFPSENGALKKTVEGLDYWVILFANQPIKELRSKLEELSIATNSDNFITDFRWKFKELLQHKNITYSNYSMDVESGVNNNRVNQVVPLFLQLGTTN